MSRRFIPEGISLGILAIQHITSLTIRQIIPIVFSRCTRWCNADDSRIAFLWHIDLSILGNGHVRVRPSGGCNKGLVKEDYKTRMWRRFLFIRTALVLIPPILQTQIAEQLSPWP